MLHLETNTHTFGESGTEIFSFLNVMVEKGGSDLFFSVGAPVNLKIEGVTHPLKMPALLPGQVKLKKGGGHAGHNGLRDIHAQLGTGDYHRLRLGIGHPGVKHEVAAYVLRKPPQPEREAIYKCIDQALDATEALLAGDMAKATAQVHAGPQRPKPPRKPPTPDEPPSQP